MEENPWSVVNLDIYLFYCCPQCDHKSKDKPNFVSHAHSCHPESKEAIIDSAIKIEEHEENLVLKSDVEVKNEDAEETFESITEGFDKSDVVEDDDWFDNNDQDVFDDNFDIEYEPLIKQSRKGRPKKSFKGKF